MRFQSTLIVILSLSVTQAFGQLNSKLVKDSTNNFEYLEYLPENTDKLPGIIIHLHGKSGKHRSYNELLIKTENNSPIRFLSQKMKNGKPYPFIILVPLLPANSTNWIPSEVNAFLEYARNKYKLDKKRVYLTGISMGGNGVWRYAYSQFNSPNKLAAIAPIAAWGNSDNGCIILSRKIPVWAFHGREDQTVPFSQGEAMFRSLNECGEVIDNSNYKFSAYDNLKHNSWSKAYAIKSEPENIYDWLWSKQLPSETKEDAKITIERLQEKAQLELIRKLPPSLNESSGVVIDKNNGIWSHNDSGNGPFLIRFDTVSNSTFLKRITQASNVDWEDITSDNNRNIYIADIGNNQNLRRELYIYKIPPLDTVNFRQEAETITFQYEDQDQFPPLAKDMNYDAESIIHFRDSLYIFSKNYTEPFNGYSKVYRLPANPGKYKAELYDSILIGTGSLIENQVTSAAVSPNQNYLALLTYNSIILLKCIDNQPFSMKEKIDIPLNGLSQKEAIHFINDTEVFITDELFRNLFGGNLYSFDLSPWLAEGCK